MIRSKVSASSSTINSDFDMVSACSMINTIKSTNGTDSSNNKENFQASNDASSQNNSAKLPNTSQSTSNSQSNKAEPHTKDSVFLLQQLKQAKEALAKCQKDKSRLESELDQNRSLMAQILACQITAKNKVRVNQDDTSQPKEYSPSDERCVGIKTFDSLAWIPLLERLEEEQVDLFVQVPSTLIPRLLGGKAGLISQTVFKSLISLTINEYEQSSVVTPPFCLILLTSGDVAKRYLTYFKDEPVNILFTRDGLFDMDSITKSTYYPTFCLTTCNHFLIELDNENNKIQLEDLTLLLMDEADYLIHDVDFVRCFMEIRSLAPFSYRTLMFSRTLDDQMSPLLSEILKVGYKTLLIGERAIGMSQTSSTFSEQSEARLIDFEECESSVSSNELSDTRHSIELYERQQILENDDEIIDDIPNLSTLNEEEDDIPGSSSGLSQQSEIDESNGNMAEQHLLSNKRKDNWPVEFIDIRPPPPPSIFPVYIENEQVINLDEQGSSEQNCNNIENNQNQQGQTSNFFEIEERNEAQEGNGLLINFDQRQSTSTLGDVYQSCLGSLKSGSTHSSNSNISSTNTNVGLNQAPNNSSNQQLQLVPLPPLRLSTFFASAPIVVRHNTSPRLSEPVEMHRIGLASSNSQGESLFGGQQQSNGIQSQIEFLEQRVDRLEQRNVQNNVQDDSLVCLDVRLDNIEERIDDRLVGMDEHSLSSNRIDSLETENVAIYQRISDIEKRMERIEHFIVKRESLMNYLNTLGQRNSDGELILNKRFNYTNSFKDLIFVGSSLGLQGIAIGASANFKVPTLQFIDEIIDHSIQTTNSGEMIPWLVINFSHSNKLDWPNNLLETDNHICSISNYEQTSTSSAYFQEQSLPNIKKRQIKNDKVIYTLRNMHSRSKFVVELYFESKSELYKRAHGFTLRRL